MTFVLSYKNISLDEIIYLADACNCCTAQDINSLRNKMFPFCSTVWIVLWKTV